MLSRNNILNRDLVQNILNWASALEDTNGELVKAKRLNTQIPIVEKRSPPDYITRNEGSLNDTRNQARKKGAESRCF